MVNICGGKSDSSFYLIFVANAEALGCSQRHTTASHDHRSTVIHIHWHCENWNTIITTQCSKCPHSACRDRYRCCDVWSDLHGDPLAMGMEPCRCATWIFVCTIRVNPVRCVNCKLTMDFFIHPLLGMEALQSRPRHPVKWLMLSQTPLAVFLHLSGANPCFNVGQGLH